jgi:hypothetical protein
VFDSSEHALFPLERDSVVPVLGCRKSTAALVLRVPETDVPVGQLLSLSRAIRHLFHPLKSQSVMCDIFSSAYPVASVLPSAEKHMHSVRPGLSLMM